MFFFLKFKVFCSILFVKLKENKVFNMITNIYTYTIDGQEYPYYVKNFDSDTQESKFLQPFELKNPLNVEVGDEDAYKVLIDFKFQEKSYVPDK